MAKFLPLPELDQSQFGSSKPLSRRYDSLEGVREALSLFANHDLEAITRRTCGESGIPQAGRLEEPLELAQFELLPDALDFQWSQSGLKKGGRFLKLGQLLRDSVLKVETGDRTGYFMMRDPPLLSSKPMSLTRVGPQTDGIKPRHLATPWAKEGSMEGFPWKLIVRRWRIDVFTGKNTSQRWGRREHRSQEPVARIDHPRMG